LKTANWLSVMLVQGFALHGHDPLADAIDIGVCDLTMAEMQR
jgi:hypothetical protein